MFQLDWVNFLQKQNIQSLLIYFITYFTLSLSFIVYSCFLLSTQFFNTGDLFHHLFFKCSRLVDLPCHLSTIPVDRLVRSCKLNELLTFQHWRFRLQTRYFLFLTSFKRFLQSKLNKFV